MFSFISGVFSFTLWSIVAIVALKSLIVLTSWSFRAAFYYLSLWEINAHFFFFSSFLLNNIELHSGYYECYVVLTSGPVIVFWKMVMFIIVSKSPIGLCLDHKFYLIFYKLWFKSHFNSLSFAMLVWVCPVLCS